MDNTLTIIQVDSKSKLNEFINCQWNFYKDDKNWVAPLKMDRKKLLNQKKNPFFLHSKIKLFLAKRNNITVGRIAAIINDNHNITHKDKVGFFGFYECENNLTTSNALFNSAENFLKQNGMESSRGPVNPSMNDENAILIDGFDTPPVVLMSYNPKYYPKLIEDSGYKKAKDTHAFLLDDKTYSTEKLNRFRSLLENRYNLTVRSMNFKNKSQFKKDVITLKNLYNEAWEPNWGFVKMTDEEFDFLVADFKQIADPDLAVIVESNGEPAGFALALPDINQSLIHNKSGNILTGIYHLLSKKKKINLVRVIVLGLIPKYQRKGIDAVLYHQIAKLCLQKGIKRVEASWILEDNDMMIKGLTTILNSNQYKSYRLYEREIK
ncbi:GNAT family N-acetyltransferase [Candidatus Kapabacteria bacterium]|nr:GNAT family N-acetyltransferase [Candidatus Kapabacteria bacterium]